MDAMYHEKILSKASDYLRGRLDPRDQADVERHLRKCRDCRGLVDRWPLVEPPGDFTGRVMAQLRDAADRGASGEERLFRWPVWGAVVAAVLVVAAFWRPESGWVRADRYFAFSNQPSAGTTWALGAGTTEGARHD